MGKKSKRLHSTDPSAAEKCAPVMKKQGKGRIVSDVLGSYTGTGQNGEAPEQDADDL